MNSKVAALRLKREWLAWGSANLKGFLPADMRVLDKERSIRLANGPALTYDVRGGAWVQLLHALESILSHSTESWYYAAVGDLSDLAIFRFDWESAADLLTRAIQKNQVVSISCSDESGGVDLLLSPPVGEKLVVDGLVVFWGTMERFVDAFIKSAPDGVVFRGN